MTRRTVPGRMALALLSVLVLTPPVAAAEPMPFESETGLWGYRSADGKTVIPPRFGAAQPFTSEGIAATFAGGAWIIIDRRGRELLRALPFDNGPDPFVEGLARFVRKDVRSGKDKVGFFDTSGRIRISPSFDFAHPFSDGLAAVCRGCRTEGGESDEHKVVTGGQWGYVDARDRQEIPLLFEQAGPFRNGRAVVRLDGQELTIDRRGNPVMPSTKSAAAEPPPTAPVAATGPAPGAPGDTGPAPFEAEDGRWGYRTSDGKTVIPPRFGAAQPFTSEGIAAAQADGAWIIIDRRGRELLRPMPDVDGPDPFVEGLARFVRNGRIGFFDAGGRIRVAPGFDFALPFSDGLAAVCRGCLVDGPLGEHKSVLGGRWGYVDNRDQLIIPLRYEQAAPFQEGRAVVRLDGQDLTIDRKGNPVKTPAPPRAATEPAPATPAVPIAATAAAESAPFKDEKGRWGYRTPQGEVIIPPRFDVARPFTPEGIAAVADNTWMIIDRQGREILRPLRIGNGPDPFQEGLARFVRNGKIGFYDAGGRVHIAPGYDFGLPFSAGLAAVCRDCRREDRPDGSQAVVGGRWGYIDARNHLVIPLRFEQAGPFEQDRALVRLDGKEVTIDRKGSPIPPELTPFEAEQGRWGYRDPHGAVAIPPRFDGAEPFSPEGIAFVADSPWMVVDRQGRELLRPLRVGDRPDPFAEGLARFVRNGRIGFYDAGGRVRIAPDFDLALPFSDGLAAVCQGCRIEGRLDEPQAGTGGRWGYVDTRGRLAIKPRFEQAEPFNQGQALVRWNGREITIDRDGKPAKPAE